MCKCKWLDEDGECELRFSDDFDCTGSKGEMYWCNIIANNAEYDRIEIENMITRWLTEGETSCK